MINVRNGTFFVKIVLSYYYHNTTILSIKNIRTAARYGCEIFSNFEISSQPFPSTQREQQALPRCKPESSWSGA